VVNLGYFDFLKKIKNKQKFIENEYITYRIKNKNLKNSNNYFYYYKTLFKTKSSLYKISIQSINTSLYKTKYYNIFDLLISIKNLFFLKKKIKFKLLVSQNNLYVFYYNKIIILEKNIKNSSVIFNLLLKNKLSYKFLYTNSNLSTIKIKKNLLETYNKKKYNNFFINLRQYKYHAKLYKYSLSYNIYKLFLNQNNISVIKNIRKNYLNVRFLNNFYLFNNTIFKTLCINIIKIFKEQKANTTFLSYRLKNIIYSIDIFFCKKIFKFEKINNFNKNFILKKINKIKNRNIKFIISEENCQSIKKTLLFIKKVKRWLLKKLIIPDKPKYKYWVKRDKKRVALDYNIIFRRGNKLYNFIRKSKVRLAELGTKSNKIANGLYNIKKKKLKI